MKKLQILIGAMIAIFSISSVNAQTNVLKKDAVLIAYYDVKNALVSDNATATNAKAKDLLAAITAFPADQLIRPPTKQTGPNMLLNFSSMAATSLKVVISPISGSILPVYLRICLPQ